MADVHITANSLEPFVTDSNEALKFKLVRKEADLRDDETTFKPEMSHQIYGENENVFGYRNLTIDLYMTSARLKALVRVNYDEKVDSVRSDGVEADSVLPPLLKILAHGQACQNEDQFVKDLKEDESFTPPGQKIDSFTVTSSDSAQRNFEIYYGDEASPGMREYHSHLQPWTMFYIDAASYIDIDDNNWRFFIMFERYMVNGSPRFAIVGYITVYQYYAYPSSIRPRVSQMLILPPFQKQGLGAKLLEKTCRHYWANPKVFDITVEDPSEDFVRLRDFVDVRNCLDLPAFAPTNAKQGFSASMSEAARTEFKLCKRQARRVYEIIRLIHTNRDKETEYKSYRIDIKKRLNIPFQKEERQLSKLKKSLTEEEFAATSVRVSTDRGMRLETLNTQYAELEEHFLKVCERVGQVRNGKSDE